MEKSTPTLVATAKHHFLSDVPAVSRIRLPQHFGGRSIPVALKNIRLLFDPTLDPSESPHRLKSLVNFRSPSSPVIIGADMTRRIPCS
jgi:hypothetical protein